MTIRILKAGGVVVELDEQGAAEFEAARAVVPVVPKSVPALYGLLALSNAGLASAYTAWAEDSARTFEERAFLTRAITWRRDNPVLQAGATALGLDAGALDALFVAAAALAASDAQS